MADKDDLSLRSLVPTRKLCTYSAQQKRQVQLEEARAAAVETRTLYQQVNRTQVPTPVIVAWVVLEKQAGRHTGPGLLPATTQLPASLGMASLPPPTAMSRGHAHRPHHKAVGAAQLQRLCRLDRLIVNAQATVLACRGTRRQKTGSNGAGGLEGRAPPGIGHVTLGSRLLSQSFSRRARCRLLSLAWRR